MDFSAMYDQFGADADGNEDGVHEWSNSGRDAVIFLIDSTASMFSDNGDADEEEESKPFDLCLKCTKTVVQNKIFSLTNDLMGVVLFGTGKTSNPSDFKNVCIFQELIQPGAEQILQLENAEKSDFSSTYGHSDRVSISDALWCCSIMFSNCKQKLASKRVMLFTNNDSPHDGDAQIKCQAASRVEDLQQNGIDLELMHLNPREGQRFNLEPFYKDVLVSSSDEPTQIADATSKFDQLLVRVRKKVHKKRVTGRMDLSLGKGLDIPIGVYNLVRRTVKPTAVKLYKKTNEEVKSVRKIFLRETGEILLPQDIKYSMTFVERQICFEQEEIAEIKSFGESGLKLVGFKPRSCIKPYFHIRPAQFIHPERRSTHHGSTRLFTALLSRCAKKDMVAICRFVPRKNTYPYYVALIPQLEELDENNVQVAPPGFHLIYLPFSDDFRKLDTERNTPKANTAQVDKAKEMLKRLQFSFDCDDFDNPQLQQHYTNVEALALDRDMPDDIKDFTLPDEERMMKRAGHLIEQFKDLVYPPGYDPAAKKKASSSGRSGGSVKKVKVDPDRINLREEAEQGKLGKLTVSDLKELTKKANIHTTGLKKADLIATINQHFGLA